MPTERGNPAVSPHWIRGFRWVAMVAVIVQLFVPVAPSFAIDVVNQVEVTHRDIKAETLDSDNGEISKLRVDEEIVARIRAPYGGITAAGRGEVAARRLRALLGEEQALESIRPERLDSESVAVVADGRVIITADGTTAEHNETTRFGLARVWSEHLRGALGLPPLSEIPDDWADWKEDEEPDGGDPDVMVASWYSDRFAGRRTASGDIYDPEQLTAAHRSLPFGTVLQVTYPVTAESVRVRVNDRGPFVSGRDLDLSRAAAVQLGMAGAGVVEVEVSVLAD